MSEEVLVSHVAAKSSSSSLHPLFQVKLLLPGDSHTLATFIDSDCNIMDEGLAMQLGLEKVPLNTPIPAKALDSHLLGTVTHQPREIMTLATGSFWLSSWP